MYERTSNASGHVKMNINLNPGTYVITANYNGLMASNTIEVLPVLSAKDISMKYSDGTKFEAKLVDGKGNPFAAQKITFNINGVFYERTTDAEGIARLNINLQAGEYIITSTFNGASLANKIIISGSDVNTTSTNLKSPEEQYFDILGPNGANGYVYYPDGTYEYYVDDIVVDGNHFGDKT